MHGVIYVVIETVSDNARAVCVYSNKIRAERAIEESNRSYSKYGEVYSIQDVTWDRRTGDPSTKTPKTSDMRV